MRNIDNHYYTLNQYMHEQFGTKVYKLALNAAVSCPNRDGKLGTKGCIFCSEGGAGDFAPNVELSLKEQIEWAKNNLSNKLKSKKDIKYIAYFQSFSNTYAPIEYLRSLFTEAVSYDEIVAISIATRPDCIDHEVIELLNDINKIKPVWVELGLQTIHEETAEYIRRGYRIEVYNDDVKMLKKYDIEVITHLIIGLPGETKEMILESVRYVCSMPINGIKLHLLHVLKGTDLADDYLAGNFSVFSLEEYAELIGECIKLIPENIVIHRITGDGPKKILIAPEWSADKKRVLNTINKYLRENEIYQK